MRPPPIFKVLWSMMDFQSNTNLKCMLLKDVNMLHQTSHFVPILIFPTTFLSLKLKFSHLFYFFFQVPGYLSRLFILLMHLCRFFTQAIFLTQSEWPSASFRLLSIERSLLTGIVQDHPWLELLHKCSPLIAHIDLLNCSILWQTTSSSFFFHSLAINNLSHDHKVS